MPYRPGIIFAVKLPSAAVRMVLLTFVVPSLISELTALASGLPLLSRTDPMMVASGTLFASATWTGNTKVNTKTNAALILENFFIAIAPPDAAHGREP